MSDTKFAAALEKLQKTNLLNALDGIKGLLIAISEDDALCDVLQKAVTGFHYETEFNKAFVKKEGRPKDDAKFIALVSTTFYYIDDGKLSLEQLISFIYKNITLPDAYQSFLKEWVLPFCDTLCNNSNGLQNSLVMEAKPSAYDKMNVDIKALLLSLSSRLEQNILYEERFIKAAKTQVDGLIYALSYNDPLLIKILFDGLKYILGVNEKDYEEIRKLDSLLRLYGVS